MQLQVKQVINHLKSILGFSKLKYNYNLTIREQTRWAPQTDVLPTKLNKVT